MSKKNDRKRKAQLSEKSMNETFKFQVLWAKKQRLPELPDDNAALQAEIATVMELGCTQEMLTLRDIVEGVHRDLGVLPEPGQGSLQGTIIPYLFGITSVNPFEDGQTVCRLETLNDTQHHFYLTVCYDNEIRNRVVDWVKERYQEVTSYMGQPILKLPKMIIEFRRLVKS
jgi:hypothetical protein